MKIGRDKKIAIKNLKLKIWVILSPKIFVHEFIHKETITTINE